MKKNEINLTLELIGSLFIFSIILFASCQTKTNEEIKSPKVIKDYEYYISVYESSGGLFNGTMFILNNLHIEKNDSDYIKYPKLLCKPLTLYCITFKSKEIKENTYCLFPSDTTEIKFSKALSDSLFNLTNSFFKSIEFDNNKNETKLVVNDCSNVEVVLYHKGQRMSIKLDCDYNYKKLDSLLHFLNKFKPKHDE